MEQQTNALAIRTVADVQDLAAIFHQSGMFTDLKTQAAAAVKIMAGQELGLAPFAAMRGIEMVEGKPTLKPELLAGLIRRGGRYDYKVLERTAAKARIAFYDARNGADVLLGVMEWTIEMARGANLAEKLVWKRYPANMLFWRAMADGVRVFCPDLGITGLYLPDEVEAEPDTAVPMIQDVTPVEPEEAAEPVEVLAIPPAQEAPVEMAETAQEPPAVVEQPKATAKAQKPAKAAEPAPVETPAPPPDAVAPPVTGGTEKIQLQDRKNMQMIGEANGLTAEDMKRYLERKGWAKSSDILRRELPGIIAEIESGEAFRIARSVDPAPTVKAQQLPDGTVIDTKTGEVLDASQAPIGL